MAGVDQLRVARFLRNPYPEVTGVPQYRVRLAVHLAASDAVDFSVLEKDEVALLSLIAKVAVECDASRTFEAVVAKRLAWDPGWALGCEMESHFKNSVLCGSTKVLRHFVDKVDPDFLTPFEYLPTFLLERWSDPALLPFAELLEIYIVPHLNAILEITERPVEVTVKILIAISMIPDRTVFDAYLHILFSNGSALRQIIEASRDELFRSFFKLQRGEERRTHDAGPAFLRLLEMFSGADNEEFRKSIFHTHRRKIRLRLKSVGVFDHPDNVGGIDASLILYLVSNTPVGNFQCILFRQLFRTLVRVLEFTTSDGRKAAAGDFSIIWTMNQWDTPIFLVNSTNACDSLSRLLLFFGADPTCPSLEILGGKTQKRRIYDAMKHATWWARWIERMSIGGLPSEILKIIMLIVWENELDIADGVVGLGRPLRWDDPDTS